MAHSLGLCVNCALRTANPGPDLGARVSSALVSPFFSLRLSFFIREMGTTSLPAFSGLSCDLNKSQPLEHPHEGSLHGPPDWVPGHGMSRTPHSGEPREGRQLTQGRTADTAGPRTQPPSPSVIPGHEASLTSCHQLRVVNHGRSMIPCGRAQGLAKIWVRAWAYQARAQYLPSASQRRETRKAEPVALGCGGGAWQSCRSLRKGRWALLVGRPPG